MRRSKWHSIFACYTAEVWRRLYLLPFNRGKCVTKESVKAIREQLGDCRKLVLQQSWQEASAITVVRLCGLQHPPSTAINPVSPAPQPRRMGGTLLMTEESVRSLQLKLRECCLRDSAQLACDFAGTLGAHSEQSGEICAYTSYAKRTHRRTWPQTLNPKP